MVVPDYRGPCLSNVVPALLARDHGLPAWLPAEAGARQVVLLVLDGLGWAQLARTVASPDAVGHDGWADHVGGPVDDGHRPDVDRHRRPAARHGVVGYRVKVGPAVVMNVLRWSPRKVTHASGPPDEFQRSSRSPAPALPWSRAPSFRDAASRSRTCTAPGCHGWQTTSTLVTNVRVLLDDGERFVYAYYERIDKVAHAFGWAITTRRRSAPATGSSTTCSPCSPRVPRWWSRPITARSTWAATSSACTPTSWRARRSSRVRVGSAGCTPVLVRASVSSRRRASATATRLGSGRATRRSRRVGSGGELSRAAESRLGDVVLPRPSPSPFLDPADVAEATMVSRHGFPDAGRDVGASFGGPHLIARRSMLVAEQGTPAEQLVVVTQPGQPGDAQPAEVESPAKVLRIAR